MRKIIITLISILLAGVFIFWPLQLLIDPNQNFTKQFINGISFLGFLFFYRLILKWNTKEENTVIINDVADLNILLKKKFVLYLRPFVIDDDNEPYGIYPTLPLLWFNTKLYPIEEQIATPFQNIGLDVISISSPKDSNFYLGTKKIKIGFGNEWTKMVELLLDKAKYICINSVIEKEKFYSNEFNGFDWEVRYCLNNVLLRTKMIILYPGKKRS